MAVGESAHAGVPVRDGNERVRVGLLVEYHVALPKCACDEHHAMQMLMRGAEVSKGRRRASGRGRGPQAKLARNAAITRASHKEHLKWVFGEQDESVVPVMEERATAQRCGASETDACGCMWKTRRRSEESGGRKLRA